MTLQPKGCLSWLSFPTKNLFRFQLFLEHITLPSRDGYIIRANLDLEKKQELLNLVLDYRYLSICKSMDVYSLLYLHFDRYLMSKHCQGAKR